MIQKWNTKFFQNFHELVCEVYDYDHADVLFPMNITLDHLKRIGKYLLTQSVVVKRTRERLEWLGDAVLRECVVKASLTSLLHHRNNNLSIAMDMCDVCCSNQTLSIVWDRTTECYLGMQSTTSHSTKWKADVVESAIGNLMTSSSIYSGLLDEIIAVIFAVSALSLQPEEIQQPLIVVEHNNWKQLDSELDDSEDDDKDDEDGEDKDVEDGEEDQRNKTNFTTPTSTTGTGTVTTTFTTGQSLRASSILGGSALHASLSLAIYHHYSTPPNSLTHQRQSAVRDKHLRWREWEDKRIFNATASSPIKLCRSKSFSGDVHEWVADQLEKNNSELIDGFCKFLATSSSEGDTTTETTKTTKATPTITIQSSSMYQSRWRSITMCKSIRSASNALCQSGIPKSALKPIVLSNRKRNRSNGSDDDDNKEKEDILKQRHKKQKISPRPRGPSFTCSQQDFALVVRFANSEVVSKIETLIHSVSVSNEKKKILVLNTPLDRKLAHAVVAAHGMNSSSVDVKVDKELHRGVQVYGCCNESSFEKCQVIAQIQSRHKGDV